MKSIAHYQKEITENLNRDKMQALVNNIRYEYQQYLQKNNLIKLKCEQFNDNIIKPTIINDINKSRMKMFDNFYKFNLLIIKLGNHVKFIDVNDNQKMPYEGHSPMITVCYVDQGYKPTGVRTDGVVIWEDPDHGNKLSAFGEDNEEAFTNLIYNTILKVDQ